MESGPGLAVGLAFAVGLVIWGLSSARLTRWNVTAPLAFVVFGLVSVNVLGVVHVKTSSTTVREIAEFALAFVLFSDAARVNMHALRHDAAIPGRLLGIGLPLTIGLGIAAALLCFTTLDPWLAAIIGAALAPTDAALGALVVDDERVPGRVRRALNVESGLNDGLASPVVTLFIVGAVEAADVVVHEQIGEALRTLGLGVLVGVGIGVVGGWLLSHERRAGWASESFVPIAVAGLALTAFLSARELDVNGFVAAFVAGLAFGAVGRDTPERTEDAMRLVALVGELLSLLLWFLFGAFAVKVLEAAPAGIVVYAFLSITVVRMLPVAVSLFRSRLHASTIVFMGWFGPRGLASVVFGLLAFDALPRHDGSLVLGAIVATVLASVVLHGMTAGPLVGAYSRRAAALDDDQAEQLAVPTLPTRRIG
jgi:NhaP-type Na+/H+ or K+/H+ antiporter